MTQKNKIWTNPQIKDNKKSHDDHTTGMTQKSRTHVFKFLTPLKSSVEKTVKLHGFKFFYKPKNIKVVLSQCGS